MIEITSKDNKIYKLCKQLQLKKYRDKLGKYLIEGPNLIEEAIKTGTEMEVLLMRKGYGGGFFGVKKTFILNEDLFDDISDTKTSQGILAVVKKSEVSEHHFFLNNKGKNYVVLDRLQDLGNIGTIIRTAAAAGYGGVIAIKGSGDIYSPKVIRAAAGSVFRLPILYAETPMQAVGLLKTHGKKILVTCFQDAKIYSEVDLKSDLALVIGNEGNGVCQDFIDLADIRVKLPMANDVESLNAAVAAGILMYETMR